MNAKAFIISNISITNFQEIELIPNNYTLRKATKKEITLLKDHLNSIYIFWYGNKEREYIYEYEFNKESGRKEPLEEESFKYWVVHCKGPNNELSNLQYSINLLKNSFDLGFQVINFKEETDGYIRIHSDYDNSKYTKVETHYHDSPTIQINNKELKEIPKIYSKLKENFEKYDFIKHSIKNFETLKNIDDNSDLKILGYFSIVEMIITHPPRLKESLDSISHQIVNKLNLLEKEFLREINYSNYFRDTKKETIWKKLYSYRSDIAHGNIKSFDKEYNLLNSKKHVYSFISEIIKNLILLALHKPDLINDLKKC